MKERSEHLEREGKMNRWDVVIVGGGPAGVTTALSAKNSYHDKKVLIIRREETSLIPCGIPYVLHSLKKVENNIMPDKPLEAAGVELMVGDVVEIEPAAKVIILRSGEKLEYDRLVMATGSTPFIPPIPGIEKKGVHLIKKEMDYLRDLKKSVEESRRIVVIGGGFIGVEVTDELLKEGKDVTIVEKLDSLLPLSMDEEFGTMVKEMLEAKGVRVLTGISVKEITGEEGTDGVELENGEKIDADLVLVAAGYRPRLELARKTGLEINERYGIIVDEYMRTSMKDVFAVGDCAAKKHFLTGEFTKLMLASTAMAQGRLAGSNLYEVKVIKELRGSLGTFSTKIQGTAFAAMGLTEREAKKLGVSYVVGRNETVDRHPGKLPGASSVYIKLIYAKVSHQLLGAQIRGGDSAGEMINTLSIMMQNNMTDMQVDTMQIGTHPLLTSSPIAYPIINATVDAITKQ